MEIFNEKKHWNSFILNKIVINCRTEEDANNLLKYLKVKDISFRDSHGNNWGMYEKDTCYACMDGRLFYSPVDYYLHNNYQVVYGENVYVTFK
jgi:hypothetical protein